MQLCGKKRKFFKPIDPSTLNATDRAYYMRHKNLHSGHGVSCFSHEFTQSVPNSHNYIEVSTPIYWDFTWPVSFKHFFSSKIFSADNWKSLWVCFVNRITQQLISAVSYIYGLDGKKNWQRTQMQIYLTLEPKFVCKSNCS